MKIKTLSILLLLFLVIGCDNYIDSETNIGVKANLHTDESRSLTDLGSVTKLELWIADEGIDYKEINPLSTNSVDFFDGLDPATLTQLGVRHLTSYSSDIEFDILTNIVQVFSLRVVFSSERVFTGETQRVILQSTPYVEIDIFESSVSSGF